jgi:8-oxo-dGTP diphosphatase
MLQVQPFARVGVAVLIIRDDRVLLIKRSGSHGAGTWATPGGHLDFGEMPEQCGVREAREETGLEVADLTFVAITNDRFEVKQKHYKLKGISA